MAAAPFELRRLKIKSAELIETAGANTSEFVQELREGFVAALFKMASTVERVEGL
jgi:hypothetical protein